jgi:hypothetical protein
MQLTLNFTNEPDCLPTCDTPEQAEIRRFLASLPDCPVVGRGECDCAACRFAWPEEYDQVNETPCSQCGETNCEKLNGCRGDGIVRGKSPKGWVYREWTVEEINQLPGVQGNY